MLNFIKKKKEEGKQRAKEYKQQAFSDFMELRNLKGLSKDDKEFAKVIYDEQDDLTSYSYRIQETDELKIGCAQLLIEQNWLIIKLLNEINQKIDR